MANESKTVSEKKEQKSGAAIKKLIPFLGLIGLFIIFAATTNGKFLTATPASLSSQQEQHCPLSFKASPSSQSAVCCKAWALA